MLGETRLCTFYVRFIICFENYFFVAVRGGMLISHCLLNRVLSIFRQNNQLSSPFCKTLSQVIMPAIPLWVHCNNCTSRDVSSLLMTSCGKVICCRCRPSLATSTCPECRGPCSRVIRLQDAPREVKVLFKDVTQELKIVMKMVNFQDLQRRNLLNHSQKKVCIMSYACCALNTLGNAFSYRV